MKKRPQKILALSWVLFAPSLVLAQNDADPFAVAVRGCSSGQSGLDSRDSVNSGFLRHSQRRGHIGGGGPLRRGRFAHGNAILNLWVKFASAEWSPAVGGTLACQGQQSRVLSSMNIILL